MSNKFPANAAGKNGRKLAATRNNTAVDTPDDAPVAPEAATEPSPRLLGDILFDFLRLLTRRPLFQSQRLRRFA